MEVSSMRGWGGRYKSSCRFEKSSENSERCLSELIGISRVVVSENDQMQIRSFSKRSGRRNSGTRSKWIDVRPPDDAHTPRDG